MPGASWEALPHRYDDGGFTSKACGRGRRRECNPAYLLQGIAWKGLDGCDHPRLGAEALEQLVVSRVKAPRRFS